VFLSVFADVIHLHEAARRATPSSTHTLAVAAPGDRSDTQDAACPICQWLRAGSELTSAVAVDATGTALQAELAPAVDDTPPSPTPLPRAFRGPPPVALL
jgi:hypothetical protein